MVVRTKSKINPLHAILFAGILILLGFYVFLVNSTAGNNFEIKILSRKLTELQEENVMLEVRTSQAQSLSALQEKGRALGLQEAVHVGYIQARSGEPLVLGN